MPASTQQTFDGGPRSPAAARRFTAAALPELLGDRLTPAVCDDVELVVSELITNAVRAGSPTVELTLAVEQSRLAVRVTDRAEGWPEERIAGIHDAGGRGLTLVSAMSVAWGVRLIDGGKVVWAEIDLS